MPAALHFEESADAAAETRADDFQRGALLLDFHGARLQSNCPPVTETEQAPTKLSQKLETLNRHTAEAPVTLGEIAATLGHNAAHLLNFILALPFIIPLPSAGLSTILGIPIAATSLRLICGRDPRLSPKNAARKLPQGFLSKLLRASRRIVLFLEKFLRPRLGTIADARRAHYLLILYSALILMLPLPIPLSNTFPAWTILLATAGIMERDGAAILAAYLAALAGAIYLAAIGYTGANIWEIIRNWFSG